MDATRLRNIPGIKWVDFAKEETRKSRKKAPVSPIRYKKTKLKKQNNNNNNNKTPETAGSSSSSSPVTSSEQSSTVVAIRKKMERTPKSELTAGNPTTPLVDTP